MKRVVDVRYGLRPITRIYRGNQLIWDKSFKKIKLIVAGVGDVQMAVQAWPTTVDDINESMMDTVKTVTLAYSEQVYCSSVCAKSVENIDAIVTPDTVNHYDANCANNIDITSNVAVEKIKFSPTQLTKEINIVTCATPTTKVVFGSGITETAIVANGVARKAQVALVTNIDQIDIHNTAYARNTDTSDAHSYNNIEIIGESNADSSIQHYVDAHSEIITDSIVTGDGTDLTKVTLHGLVKIDGVLSESDKPIVDIMSYNHITTNSNACGDNLAPTSTLMSGTVGTDSGLHISDDVTVDVIAYGHIHTYATLQTPFSNPITTQSYGLIDIGTNDHNIGAIVWTNPILNNNTLIIRQAYRIDDSNLPTLQII